MVFNDAKVQLATNRKHLGLILDSKLDFNEPIDNKINKCNKIIGIVTFFNSVKKKLAKNIQIHRQV